MIGRIFQPLFSDADNLYKLCLILPLAMAGLPGTD